MTPFPHPAHRTGQADFPHPALGQDFTPLLSRATPSAVSEHLSEFIGCPISRSVTTYCVCLELRSLPSASVTRLPRYYEPLRHPKAPGLSLAGLRLVIADHDLGLPVFRTLSLCTCRRHYPGAASGRTASLISSRRISLPRKGGRVGLRIVLFEACSAFTRVAACTLALSPIRDTLIEGFSHFVTSMTAPIASGWSGCRVGLAPTGKRRLYTAHAISRQCPTCRFKLRMGFGSQSEQCSAGCFSSTFNAQATAAWSQMSSAELEIAWRLNRHARQALSCCSVGWPIRSVPCRFLYRGQAYLEHR